MHEFGFIFAGFFVGLVVGLTGVGGGSLMTPILIFFFGIKPYLAVGTDLLFAAFTKGACTLSLALQRLVPWRVVFTLCAGSLPASALTLWVLHEVGPAEPAVQQVMKSTLGIALLLTAMAMLYKAIRGKKAPQSLTEDAIENATRASPLGVARFVWRHHRRARHIDFCWRRRHRRNRVDDFVSPVTPCTHCCQRHCLRCATHLGSRFGTCVYGLGRLVIAVVVAGRFPPWHLDWIALGAQST
jgi:uncharacterized membrane protein YfcA